MFMPSNHDMHGHGAEDRSYGKAAVPSRKWFAATFVGAGTICVDWAQAGHWSTVLTVAAIGFGVQRLVAYVTPNKES